MKPPCSQVYNPPHTQGQGGFDTCVFYRVSQTPKCYVFEYFTSTSKSFLCMKYASHFVTLPFLSRT